MVVNIEYFIAGCFFVVYDFTFIIHLGRGYTCALKSTVCEESLGSGKFENIHYTAHGQCYWFNGVYPPVC